MKFTLIFCLILTAIGCRPSAAPVAIGDKPVSVNDVGQPGFQMPPIKPLPEMSWTSFDGKIGKIKDLEGKVIILDFWATNCPPCIEEIPHLVSLQQKYPDDLKVIGLHVGDDEDRAKVPEFVERLKISYHLAYPEEALTSFIFQRESAIPQTAIFDRQGKLVKKIIGFNAAIQKDLDEAVEKTVSGK